MTTNFQAYLQTAIAEIQAQLHGFEQECEQEILQVSPLLDHLVQTFTTANQGGKRLRAVLVKLGYEMCQAQTATPAVLRAALAFEVFQTAILIHDDIIDQSPLRRGKPTVHKQLAKLQGTDHYGIAQGICLGDIGMFWALQLISNSEFEVTTRLKATNSFLHTILYTGIGELLDVELAMHKGSAAQEADVIKIYLHKTAHYTITGALQLGAILGQAPDLLLKQLKEYGDNLGIAFQIHDDILGVFGNEMETGKSASSDIEEGKITILSLYAQTQATMEQQVVLAQCYGKGSLSVAQVAAVREVFVATGALAYAEKTREMYLQKALQVIPSLAIREAYQQLLKSIAYLMVERKH